MNREHMRTATCNAGERFIVDPDLDPIADMMIRSWPRPCKAFSVELLNAYLRRPTGDPTLAIALYRGSQVAGFHTLVPYTISYGGRAERVVLGKFWTVDPRVLAADAAGKLQREGIRMALEKDYAGLFSITEADTTASKGFELTFRFLGRPFSKVATFPLMMGLPRMCRRKLPVRSDLPVRRYTAEFRESCAELLASLAGRVELCRAVPPEDVDFLLHDRAFTHTWLLASDDRVRALMNVMRVKTIGNREAVNAYAEHLVLGDVSDDEARGFLGAVFADRFWDDIAAVYAASTGTFDPAILTSGGFLVAPTHCNLYFVPLGGRLQIDRLSSFYLDVF
jgi:hypothetical protein